MTELNRQIDQSNKVAVLEHKVKLITDELVKFEAKLDQILDLRAKGQGAFWVASALFGTGIVAILIPLINWLRGI